MEDRWTTQPAATASATPGKQRSMMKQEVMMTTSSSDGSSMGCAGDSMASSSSTSQASTSLPLKKRARYGDPRKDRCAVPLKQSPVKFASYSSAAYGRGESYSDDREHPAAAAAAAAATAAASATSNNLGGGGPSSSSAGRPPASSASAASGAVVLKPSPFFYYTDHSTDEDEDPLSPLTPMARVPNFPAKMHAILAREDLGDVIKWLPHGRSWKILKPREFEIRVLPTYFDHAKCSSFIRQANGWGFRRVTQGKDRNSYYHELFLRGLPHLCKKMRRPGVSRKTAANPEHEPNFYEISKVHPVPDKLVNGDDDGILLEFTVNGGPRARMPVVHSGIVPPPRNKASAAPSPPFTTVATVTAPEVNETSMMVEEEEKEHPRFTKEKEENAERKLPAPPSPQQEEDIERVVVMATDTKNTVTDFSSHSNHKAGDEMMASSPLPPFPSSTPSCPSMSVVSKMLGKPSGQLHVPYQGGGGRQQQHGGGGQQEGLGGGGVPPLDMSAFAILASKAREAEQKRAAVQLMQAQLHHLEQHASSLPPQGVSPGYNFLPSLSAFQGSSVLGATPSSSSSSVGHGNLPPPSPQVGGVRGAPHPVDDTLGQSLMDAFEIVKRRQDNAEMVLREAAAEVRRNGAIQAHLQDFLRRSATNAPRQQQQQQQQLQQQHDLGVPQALIAAQLQEVLRLQHHQQQQQQQQGNGFNPFFPPNGL